MHLGKTSSSSLLILLGVLVFGMSGCGGGSDGTGSFSSSFNDQRSISSFTPAEFEQLCTEVNASFERLQTPETLCPLIALLTALEPPRSPTADEQIIDCNDADAVCREEFDENFEKSPAPKCSGEDFDNEGCDLPFAVLKGCITDSFDELFGTLGALTCDEAATRTNVDDIEALFGDFISKLSPACAEIRATCPKLLE